MSYADYVPEWIPPGFSFEVGDTSLRLGYRPGPRLGIVILLLGLGLSWTQLRGLPALMRSFDPEYAQTLSIAYPEHYGWLAPLAYVMFTLASLSLVYTGFALLIDEHVLELDQDLMLSYEHPLLLSRRRQASLEQVASVRWKEKLAGAGAMSIVTYPVYLVLKNGKHHSLMSFDRARDAIFLHELLSNYLGKSAHQTG